MARVSAVGPSGASASDWSNTFLFGLAPGAFTNGSFESDYTGWVVAGNAQLVLNGAYGSAVSDGAKAIAFNGGQRPATGVVSQPFATVVGQTYTLMFDVGAFSMVNLDAQGLQVTVQGASTVLSRAISVTANGAGTRYVGQQFSFVADQTVTTLTFRDVSATTEDVDLFLDNVRIVDAVAPPSIGTQPQSVTVAAGSPASFTVGASGGGTLAYQWYFNGQAIGGATSSSYALGSVQSSQAGSYGVTVSNAGGAVSSAAAVLTVLTPPVLTSQPQSATVVVGSPVTFAVTATGSGTLSYQWSFNGQALTGATASSFTIASAQVASAGSYSVAVRGSGGSVSSSAAVLSVVSASPMGLVNGGFESSYSGWTPTGNQQVTTGTSVTEGSKAIVFNSGQKTPNGVLTQTFATVAGQSYTLAFDAGAFSLVNKGTQKLKVTVQGTALLLSQAVSVTAKGAGAKYSVRSFTFVADRSTTTLTFQDQSATTTNIDLLLDNVRVTARSK